MSYEFPYQVSIDESEIVLLSERPDLVDFYPENFIYAGSQITVWERAVITLEITQPSLIDRDHRWFEPKTYLGNYQILEESEEEDDEGATVNFATGTDDPNTQGKLVATRVQLSRYQQLTIGDMDQQPRLDGVLGLDGCNTSQIEATLTLPGGIVVAATDFQESVDIYTGRVYRTVPNIQSIFYRPLLLAIGLYLFPGVEFVSASLFLEVTNIVTDDAAIQPPPQCQEESTCDDEYAVFTGPSTPWYSSLAACEAELGAGACFEFNNWACSTDPSDQRPHWQGS